MLVVFSLAASADGVVVSALAAAVLLLSDQLPAASAVRPDDQQGALLCSGEAHLAGNPQTTRWRSVTARRFFFSFVCCV